MHSKKIVLITGATRGIGLAVANELSRRGHIVYGAGRSKPETGEILYRCLPLDITNGTAADAAVARILKEQGRLDILINNAGIGQCGPVEETPLETARGVFETNYFAMLRMIQAVLPIMRRQGSGVIANVSSASGRIGIPFQAQYAASKFAVEGLSEGLYHEVRPLGIRVLLIEPGDVGTTIWTGTEKHLPGESAYRPALQCFLAVKEKEMGGQADAPERVARQIANAVLSNTGRLRYPVARMAGLILMARKLLPDWVFLKLMARNYHLPE